MIYLRNRFYLRGTTWLGLLNTVLACLCNRVLVRSARLLDGKTVRWSIGKGTDFPPAMTVEDIKSAIEKMGWNWDAGSFHPIDPDTGIQLTDKNEYYFIVRVTGKRRWVDRDDGTVHWFAETVQRFGKSELSATSTAMNDAVKEFGE